MIYRIVRRNHLRLMLVILALAWGAGMFAAHPAPVSQAQTEARYFPETGHFLGGLFRVFWESNEGLELFGFPLTEEYVAQSTGRITQYFERARFELAEVDGQAYVELGRLGSEITAGRVFPKVPPIENTDDRRYIPETQHIIQYGFKEIWETRGSVRIFGYPISEEINELFPDGTWRTVQYFERARFEYWPQYADGERVLLTNLGRALVPPELTAPVPPEAVPEQPAQQPGDEGGGGGEDWVPESYSARVEPNIGPPGTTFLFDAWNFEPNESVGIWLTAPDQSTYDAGFQAIADDQGSIGYEGIGVTTTPDFPDGVWSFNAQGVRSGWQAIGYFRISRTASSAPPTGGGTAGTLPVPPAGDGSRLGAMIHDTLPVQGEALILPVAGPPGAPFLFLGANYTPGEEVGSWVTKPDQSTENIPAERIFLDSDGVVEVLVQTDGYQQAAHAVAAQGRSTGVSNAAAFLLTTDYFAGPGTPRPPQSNSTVNPEEGFIGNVFQIRSFGFAPGEEVELWTTEPHGIYTLLPLIIEADAQGRVGYDPTLDLQTDSDYYLGVYGIHFRGLATGVRADAYFTLRAYQGAGGPGVPVGEITSFSHARSAAPDLRSQVEAWASR